MSDEVSARRAEAEDARVITPIASSGIRGRLQRAAAGPLAEAQQTFNGRLLRLADALSTRVDAAAKRAVAAERRVAELEERLLRLERRDDDGRPRTIASQPRQDAIPDYFAYEARMRAPTEEIRERQRPYVELVRGHEPVLDVGCGRGELLQLLRDEGIEARGVDADADMAAFARGAGLNAQQRDLLDALGATGDESLGAITALQVVEHLPPRALVDFLAESARTLRAGGLLVAETINPVSPAALRHYFADLTHAQPLVPETLELLARQAGFGSAEIRFMNEPEQHPDTRISEQLFAPLDYALIARK
ncbi:MAG: glycosyltransferase [Actinomycetia bacterium]|nr:glycosyltransferase [Actinomycetes bacterium]